MDNTIRRPLRVAHLMSSKKGDERRGPAIWLHPDDARERLLTDGELAWIYGPRRHELAEVHVDPGMRRGEVFLRDVLGAAPSEIVRVIKPDLDRRDQQGMFA